LLEQFSVVAGALLAARRTIDACLLDPGWRGGKRRGDGVIVVEAVPR
jgi:hypothetical protein